MLDAIASLFGYLMNFIYAIVQNYGVAIIIFTILVKLLLLPSTLKQQKSMEKAQEMQPLVQELQRKYGNDQQRFAEEYQKLLQSKNMSMMSSMGCSGCLINFIQLPILLGMFYMMVNPLTHIMKIDETKIEEYKNEINTARMNQAIAQLEANSGDYVGMEYNTMIENAKKASYVDPRYYEIDIIKDSELLELTPEEKKKLDIDMNFFGINLCDIAQKNTTNKVLLIIPILSTLFTYLSLHITNMINKKKGIVQPKPEDSDIPMPDMRVMNIMMPLMLGYVAYSVPQGVGLYWTTSNLLGVIQIIALRLVFDKGETKANDGTITDVKYKIIHDDETKQKEVTEKQEKNNQSPVVENKSNVKNSNQKSSNNKKKKNKKKK